MQEIYIGLSGVFRGIYQDHWEGSFFHIETGRFLCFRRYEQSALISAYDLRALLQLGDAYAPERRRRYKRRQVILRGTVIGRNDGEHDFNGERWEVLVEEVLAVEPL